LRRRRRRLDAAYPTHTAIKLILDNHSAHISKQTKDWLAKQPAGRFEFTLTPKHGSWLNLMPSRSAERYASTQPGDRAVSLSISSLFFG
jgi:hypothetical protein